MDEFSSKTSNMVFDHFKKGNYDAVLDMLDRIKENMSKHEGEENEGSYVQMLYLPPKAFKNLCYLQLYFKFSNFRSYK